MATTTTKTTIGRARAHFAEKVTLQNVCHWFQGQGSEPSASMAVKTDPHLFSGSWISGILFVRFGQNIQLWKMWASLPLYFRGIVQSVTNPDSCFSPSEIAKLPWKSSFPSCRKQLQKHWAAHTTVPRPLLSSLPPPKALLIHKPLTFVSGQLWALAQIRGNRWEESKWLMSRMTWETDGGFCALHTLTAWQATCFPFPKC